MTKIKTRIAASLVASAFAVAAGALHLDWVGYDYFDRESGSNALCTLDPTCRQFSDEEIAVARKYFGDSINYKNVKIFERPFLYMVGHNNTGVSPNGHIYFARRDDYRPNFARDEQSMPIFIHEMTHVAQYQSGMNIPKQAFITLLRHGFNYEAAYKYELHTSRNFGEMNLEQQAAMMEDYFIKRQAFEQNTTVENTLNGTPRPMRFATFGPRWIKERCRELKQYESKLAPIYNITPDELCQPPAPQFRLKIDEARFFSRP